MKPYEKLKAEWGLGCGAMGIAVGRSQEIYERLKEDVAENPLKADQLNIQHIAVLRALILIQQELIEMIQEKIERKPKQLLWKSIIIGCVIGAVLGAIAGQLIIFLLKLLE